MQTPTRPRLLATLLCCGPLLALGCTGSIGEGRPSPGTGNVPGSGTGPGGSPGSGNAPVAPDAPRTCSASQLGPSPLHRLTRLEYDNTIRELLGEDLKLAREFNDDERAGNFTGNSFTPISEMQFTQYATAATAAADRVVALLPRLVPCDLAGDAVGCATQFIKQFGRRALRRPVEDGEVDRYVKLFEVGRTGAGADPANGIRLVVQAMLQSPKFIYLVEGPGPLTQHQMAARLSYFLWNAPPDAQLAAAADAGQLGTLAGLRQQAGRLLADPRAGEMIADFHGQWLGLGRLPKLQKDQALYGEFDSIRGAIIEETGRFVAEVMSADGGRLESLLSAPFAVVNGPLAALYGVSGASGDSGARWPSIRTSGRGCSPRPASCRLTAPWTAALRSGAGWRFASACCAPRCRSRRPGPTRMSRRSPPAPRPASASTSTGPTRAARPATS